MVRETAGLAESKISGLEFFMKIRIISASVAIVIALIVLFLHKTIVLEIAIALLIVGMLFELFRATKCLRYLPTTIICYAYGLTVPFFQFMGKWSGLVTLCWAMLCFATLLYQFKTIKFDKFAVIMFFTVFITASMNSLISIHNLTEDHGLFLIVLTLCGAWLADSGAYFAGTFFGKHKLCPNISPKKTVEGFIGGTITNGLIFLIIAVVYSKLIVTDVTLDYFLLFIYGMACSVIGLLGDLSASLVKRQYEIKDYGNIMPGHGGIMDRFDSVLFVAPFMYAVLSYFPIFG